MFSVIVVPSFSATAEGPRHHKPREKQVAMIAQKVVDANQAHRQRRPFITSANAGTTAFWTLLKGHSSDSLTILNLPALPFSRSALAGL